MTIDGEIQGQELAGILDASHENKWVAVAPDYSRVIGVADRLADLMPQVTDPAVIFHRVLPRNAGFV